MLKPLAEVAEPDTRYGSMTGPDGRRPMRLEHHYEAISRICLSPEVPEQVTAQFERAQHVLIYAWFCYDLLVVAELQALSALEAALRARVGEVLTVNAPHGLWQLLRVAHAQRWLPANISEDLVSVLPRLRNDLAHGSHDIVTPSMALTVLDLCASMIRALWVNPDGTV